MKEIKDNLIKDDLIRMTQEMTQRRLLRAEELREEKKRRKIEIVESLLAAAGTGTTFGSCFCVEKAPATTMIGGLIGIAMIAASALIEIITYYKED